MKSRSLIGALQVHESHNITIKTYATIPNSEPPRIPSFMAHVTQDTSF